MIMHDDGFPALPGQFVVKLPRTCKQCGGDWTAVADDLKKGLLDQRLQCPYCGRTVNLPATMTVPAGQVILDFGDDRPRKKGITASTFDPNPIANDPVLKRIMPTDEREITQFVRFSNRVTVVIGVMIVLALLIIVLFVLVH
jgi:hypothetical protein